MRKQDRTTTVLALAAYNLVQNLLVSDRAYVPANLAATGALIGMARIRGATWDDLGLHPAKAKAGLLLGAAGAGVAVAIVFGGRSHPAAGAYFLDQRAADQHNHEVVYRASVRFPLGTALFEEVAFRGVVPAVWTLSGATKREGALAAAAAFGLWHIIPGKDALDGNPLASQLGQRGSQVIAVAAGTVITGLASLGFSWMRDRSGSLLAPWMTHAAVNSATYLAGVAAWRRAERRAKASPA